MKLFWKDATQELFATFSPKEQESFKGMEAHHLFLNCSKCQEAHHIAYVSFCPREGISSITYIAPTFFTAEHKESDVEKVKQRVEEVFNILMQTLFELTEDSNAPEDQTRH